MPRRHLEFATLADARAEAMRLHVGGYDRLGQWNLAQICDHLTAFTLGCIDGHPYRVPWLFKVLFGRLVLRRILSGGRMKPGIPTPQNPLPSPDGDEAIAVARYAAAIERFEAYDGRYVPSPFFGQLTAEQWRDLHRIHAQHHLGFLAPR